ncbi:MAG: hypothetical protein WCC68_06890, partial [Methanoregula sp.]
PAAHQFLCHYRCIIRCCRAEDHHDIRCHAANLPGIPLVSLMPPVRSLPILKIPPVLSFRHLL